MNFNIQTALASVAPTLATMLGGPLAGTAVTALEGALGLAPGAGADGITSVLKAGNMTPDQLAAVRAADQKHAETLQQMQIDVQKLNADAAAAATAAEIDDRKSARTMQTATRSYTVPALAWLVVVGFIAVIGLKLTGHVAPSDQTAGDLITTLRDSLILVLSFYFGSSHGSQAKDAVLAQAVKSSGG